MVVLFGQDSLHGYGVHGGGERTGCSGRDERREMIFEVQEKAGEETHTSVV